MKQWYDNIVDNMNSQELINYNRKVAEFNTSALDYIQVNTGIENPPPFPGKIPQLSVWSYNLDTQSYEIKVQPPDPSIHLPVIPPVRTTSQNVGSIVKLDAGPDPNQLILSQILNGVNKLLTKFYPLG